MSLQVVATDADNDTLTYSAQNLPGGLSISASTGLITGTVSSTAATSSPFSSSVTANDGKGGSDTKSITWTITDTTTPRITNPGNQSTNEGASVNLPISASDGDNDTLTYGATGLPTGLSINPVTGVISGTISAGAASSSPFRVHVTAGDGKNTGSADFSWSVNGPPVVTSPGNQ